MLRILLKCDTLGLIIMDTKHRWFVNGMPHIPIADVDFFKKLKINTTKDEQ